MPNYYTATAAKGTVGVMLETSGSPGMQQLLAPTAVISTVTGISAPSGSTGMRLLIRITNYTTSGTFTISGTGSPSNSEGAITVAAPTAQQTQSAQVASFEYVSTNAFTAVTNITTTGMANGIISVFGIQAAKFNLPSVMKSQTKFKMYSPNEHNGFIERDKKLLQLVNESTIDEVKQDVYGDLSLWWPYVMLGSPTSATIPATPASIVASTPVTAGSPATFSPTAPTAPGMRLIIVVSSYTVSGTITVTGTVNGVSGVSEVINVTANGTLYSSNVYSAISSIANASYSATVVITGVFGWALTFLSGGSKYTAALEWYDGVGSWTHPFCLFTEGDFDIKVTSEATITAKGVCQNKLPIGVRTTTPLSGTSRVTSLGANLNDLPLVGWQTAVYVDDITGTPLTTTYGDMQELKVSLKSPDEHHYTFVNSQYFNRAYVAKREVMLDCTINFIDLVQYEKMRQNLKQYIAFQFLGQYIGTDSGNSTAYYKSWTWTVPFRTDGTFDISSDPSKAIVTAKANWRAEYDSGIGGACKLVVVTSLPPTYPN
jgi:hypothetical protein